MFKEIKNLAALIIISAIFILSNSCAENKNLNILTIGDSNGAAQNGWVYQLKHIRSNDSIINFSIGGNTIGFNNLDKDTLNTLKNVSIYLSVAEDMAERIDKIIVVLGTNDCKAVFDSLQDVVVENLDSLVHLISSYNYKNKKPRIYLSTPPPAAVDSLLIPKYYGIRKRLNYLIPYYENIARKYNCTYIDIYNPLLTGFDTLNLDGIHLNDVGYIEMAKIIDASL